jgi:hypothetical protein
MRQDFFLLRKQILKNLLMGMEIWYNLLVEQSTATKYKFLKLTNENEAGYYEY